MARTLAGHRWSATVKQSQRAAKPAMHLVEKLIVFLREVRVRSPLLKNVNHIALCSGRPSGLPAIIPPSTSIVEGPAAAAICGRFCLQIATLDNQYINLFQDLSVYICKTTQMLNFIECRTIRSDMSAPHRRGGVCAVARRFACCSTKALLPR
jgi:hypothetical protein